MNMSKGNILPAFARRGECAQLKRSREATFEGRRRGGCVILRSLLIDARAAHRLKRFNKERFAGINKEASRYYQPPRLRLQRNGSIFLDAQPPRLAKAGNTLASTSLALTSLPSTRFLQHASLQHASLRHRFPSTSPSLSTSLPFDSSS